MSALERNAARNRGSAQSWFQHSDDSSDTQPKQRVRPEAQQIASKQTASHIPFDPRAPADARQAPGVSPLRVRGGDAFANATKQRNPPEKWFEYDADPNPENRDWHKNKAVSSDEPVEMVKEVHSIVHGKQIKEKMTRSSDWFVHEAAPDVNSNVDGKPARNGDCERTPQRPADCERTPQRPADYERTSQRSADCERAQQRPVNARDEGKDYAMRNTRGTSSDWMLTHDPNYSNEKPTQRLVSRQATEIFNKHAGSAMKSCLNYDEDGETLQQRNKAAGADRQRGQMGLVFDHASDADYREEAPKSRPASAVAQKQLFADVPRQQASEESQQRVAMSPAQYYAARSAGIGSALLAHDANAPATPSQRRMPPDAQRIANSHASNDISKTLQMVPFNNPSTR